MGKTYRSAVGWLGAVLVVPAITSSAVVVAALASGDRSMLLIGLAALVGYASLLVGLVLPMRYLIGDHGVVVRFGLVRVRIPWDRLIEARPTRVPLAGPALSFARLELRYRKPSGATTFVLISPIDRDEFIRACAAASPRHAVTGGALVEKSG